MFYKAFRPLLFCLDAEFAHHLAISFLKMGIGLRISHFDHPSLHTKVCGLSFRNPVGLAAGFDKQAEIIGPALNMGFGFTELGSITPLPQKGNPKPRVFRVPEVNGVINRLGFNSDGIEVCRRRLQTYRNHQKSSTGIVGINIGKNKDSKDAAADYVLGIKAFAPFADYLTVNISSPNTPGLRDLQRREPLLALLRDVLDARNGAAKTPPLFVKIAPDLTPDQNQDIADVILEMKVDGVIIGNTTLSRPDHIPPHLSRETGGLSGQPLASLSTRTIADFYKLTGGKIPIIGCGGIACARDAYDKIRAGASLVQLYTGMIYEGPSIALRINRDLVSLLERDGFISIAEAVGTGGIN